MELCNDINKCDLLMILSNKMCLYVEEPHKSLNIKYQLIFFKWFMHDVTISYMSQTFLETTVRLMKFNVTIHWHGFRFYIANNLDKTTTYVIFMWYQRTAYIIIWKCYWNMYLSFQFRSVLNWFSSFTSAKMTYCNSLDDEADMRVQLPSSKPDFKEVCKNIK